jgi:hypothetical protein
MLTIRVRSDQGRALYDVALADGQVVRGLRPGQLGTYGSFRTAAALQGAFVDLFLPYGAGPLTNRNRDSWLRLVAEGIRAGQAEAQARKRTRRSARKDHGGPER